jgi:SAM-dependent methyltransferase
MIDFGKTAADYSRYRVPFAPRLLQKLRDFDIGHAGQRILDVGSGTGLLAAELQRADCAVVQVDLSLALMKESAGPHSRIVSRVENLPLANESFDTVTAAQCWHWFDRRRAPRELMRILRPGGRVAIIYQTYIPLPGSIAARTEALILRYCPGWRHANSTGINGQALRDLQICGFQQIESFSFDVEISFTRLHWRGYIRASSAVGASMSPQELQQFDGEHQALIDSEPEVFQIPHRVFAAIARKPADRL